jgi:hypothetical protein
VLALRDGSWLTLPRLRAYALLLASAYALFVGWLFATSTGALDASGRPLGTDFANIWSTGVLVLQGRPEVAFDPAQQRPFQQALFGMGAEWFYGWHYPPMFLAVAGALAIFPYITALIAWQAMTISIYVGTIQRIMADVRTPIGLVGLTALAYPAVLANVTHGHNGALSATLLGYGLVLLHSRPVAAGFLIGLVAYKPQYGLLMPFALAAIGAWRAMASAASTVIVTAGMSALLFGVESWHAFFKHAAYTRETILEQGAAGWFKLQGVFPAVRMLGGSIASAYVMQAVATMGLIVAVVWLWRRPASHEQKAAGLLIATVLATPYAFNYDMVVLGPAIAFLVVDGARRGFAPYEISLLALLWATPLVSRDLTLITHAPVAILAQAAMLGLLILKVARIEARDRSLAHA